MALAKAGVLIMTFASLLGEAIPFSPTSCTQVQCNGIQSRCRQCGTLGAGQRSGVQGVTGICQNLGVQGAFGYSLVQLHPACSRVMVRNRV